MNTHESMNPNLPLWSFQFKPNSQLALQTRKDLEIHLITRALKDEDFKQELLANPKAVIEQELDQKLPEDLEIQVLEETEDTIYMVLPCNPYEGMSEEQLQAALGMTYEDVARWVLDQQRNTVVDSNHAIQLITNCWRNRDLKDRLIREPLKTIKAYLTLELSQNIFIKIFEEKTDKIFVILPNPFIPSLSIYLQSLSSLTYSVEVSGCGIIGDDSLMDTIFCASTNNYIC